MRPFTSRLLSAACLAAASLGAMSDASAQTLRGGSGLGSGSHGHVAAGVRSRPAGGFEGNRRGCRDGRGGCAAFGSGPYYGYGYGVGAYGYGYGGYDFDPRLLPRDLPSERESVVPAVAGIRPPPVEPPAIYVIGDGEARATHRGQRRAGGSSSARVVRMR